MKIYVNDAQYVIDKEKTLARAPIKLETVVDMLTTYKDYFVASIIMDATSNTPGEVRLLIWQYAPGTPDNTSVPRHHAAMIATMAKIPLNTVYHWWYGFREIDLRFHLNTGEINITFKGEHNDEV